MAVLWQKNIDNDLYQVRSAGNSRRLYSNGVFHSHYNPNHALSNSIWDLLVLPALFQKSDSVRRVLLMGVGGGTAIKLLNRYLKPQKIVGVEINDTHLYIAKKFFGITKKEAELIHADAISWIRNYKGPKFDLIIDDMFGHAQGDIQRAVALNTSWFNTLHRNLDRNGLLVINTTEKQTLRQSAYFTNQKINKLFDVVYCFEHPTCDNYVGAFYKNLRLKKDLMHNIAEIQNRKYRNALLAMDYKIARLG